MPTLRPLLILLLGTGVLAAAAIDVTVDFAKVGGGPELRRDWLGGFTPEKIGFAAGIYDPDTLRLLRVPFIRVVVPTTRSGSTFIDEGDAVRTIVGRCRSAGLQGWYSSIVPDGLRSRLDHAGSRAQALAEVTSYFRSLATALRGFHGNGVPFTIELFNEPDLGWSPATKWGYGPAQFERFYEEFTAAWRGVRQANAGATIGGPGLCFTAWLPQLLTRLGRDGITLDFLSVHDYLGWTDATTIAGTDPGHATVARRATAVQDALPLYRLPDGQVHRPLVWLSEYNWLDGDAGRGPITGTGYKDLSGCMRTLEAIDIALRQGVYDRVAWAQFNGQKTNGVWGLDLDDFYSLYNYDWKSGAFHVKPATWAFGWFAHAPGRRRVVGVAAGHEQEIKAFAASDGKAHRLAVWNRTKETRELTLVFPGISNAAVTCRLVDAVHDSDFIPPGITQRLDADRHLPLTLIAEGCAFIELTGGIDQSPPRVQWLSPSGGSSLVLGATTILQATASDDVQVDCVEFLANGHVVGNGTAVGSTWHLAWKPATTGNWNLTARAWDPVGHHADSTAAMVTVREPVSLRIDFRPHDAPAVAGWIMDAGLPFGDRGDGLQFGWSRDVSATARIRNATSGPQGTLIHMQKDGHDDTWQIALPAGRYQVRLVAGDPAYFDSVYRLTLDGAVVLDGRPDTTHRWTEADASIQVRAGRLTLGNATGAVNNKICLIEITEVPSGVG